MQLIIPPCLLVDNTEAGYLSTMKYKLEIFDWDATNKQCGTTVSSLTGITFNKNTLSIIIPANTFPDTTWACAKITTPETTDAPFDTIEQVSIDIALIPEHIFPLVYTSFGNYIEAAANTDLVINFSQKFDPDFSASVVNIWDCQTICGKSCDYLNPAGYPRKIVGTFADGDNNDVVNRSLTIAAGQLEESKIYRITIYAKYQQLQG